MPASWHAPSGRLAADVRLPSVRRLAKDLDAARQLAEASIAAGANLDDDVRILCAIWPQESPGTDVSRPPAESADER